MSPLKACDRYAPNIGTYLSVADILLLESLPEDVRRVIDKYAKVGGDVNLVPDLRMHAGTADGVESEHSVEYRKGWAAAIEHARDEIEGVSLRSEPPRKRR